MRNTRAGAGGKDRAGVMFLGRVPPRGYDVKPAGRFRLPDATSFVGPDRVTRLSRELLDHAGFDRRLQAAGAPPLPVEAP